MSYVLGQGCCNPEDVSEVPFGTVPLAVSRWPVSSGLGPLGLCPFDPHLTIQCLEATLGCLMKDLRALMQMVETSWAPVCAAQCDPPCQASRTLGVAEAKLEMESVHLHIREHTNRAHLEDVTGVTGTTMCAYCS